jgi:hypothetical protein
LPVPLVVVYCFRIFKQISAAAPTPTGRTRCPAQRCRRAGTQATMFPRVAGKQLGRPIEGPGRRRAARLAGRPLDIWPPRPVGSNRACALSLRHRAAGIWPRPRRQIAGPSDWSRGPAGALRVSVARKLTQQCLVCCLVPLAAGRSAGAPSGPPPPQPPSRSAHVEEFAWSCERNGGCDDQRQSRRQSADSGRPTRRTVALGPRRPFLTASPARRRRERGQFASAAPVRDNCGRRRAPNPLAPADTRAPYAATTLSKHTGRPNETADRVGADNSRRRCSILCRRRRQSAPTQISISFASDRRAPLTRRPRRPAGLSKHTNRPQTSSTRRSRPASIFK